MAHLTNTQKKSRNSFIALLIGIILVIAAIGYVLFGGITSKSAYLENQDFAKALATAMHKTARGVSKDDLAAVKYLEVSYDATNKQYSVALGDDEFVSKYEDFRALSDAASAAADSTADEAASEESADETTAAPTQEEITAAQEEVQKLAKTATFDGDDKSVFTDLQYFTGVDTISLSSVTVPDASIFAGFTNLRKGYFYSAGITDVSAFGNLDLDKIEELDFTGNTIEDWSALESIGDKVTVTNSYTIGTDDQGNQTLVPFVQNLTQYLEEQAKQAEEGADAGTDETTGDNADGATDDAADTTDTADNTTTPEASSDNAQYAE